MLLDLNSANSFLYVFTFCSWATSFWIQIFLCTEMNFIYVHPQFWEFMYILRGICAVHLYFSSQSLFLPMCVDHWSSCTVKNVVLFTGGVYSWRSQMKKIPLIGQKCVWPNTSYITAFIIFPWLKQFRLGWIELGWIEIVRLTILCPITCREAC